MNSRILKYTAIVSLGSLAMIAIVTTGGNVFAQVATSTATSTGGTVATSTNGTGTTGTTTTTDTGTTSTGTTTTGTTGTTGATTTTGTATSTTDTGMGTTGATGTTTTGTTGTGTTGTGTTATSTTGGSGTGAGTPVTPNPAMLTMPLCEMERALRIGSTGDDVHCLQRYLNWAGYTISTTGAGSPGNESSYYGQLTADAVSRWQQAYAAQVLTPAGLSIGTGTWGPASIGHYVTLVRTVFGV